MVRRLTRSERLSGYNPRLDEERCKAMNESKVGIIFGHDCNVSTAYTTHADYRALEEESRRFQYLCESQQELLASMEGSKRRLEERYERWKEDWDDVHNATLEELASIKARAGELVAAAENTLAVEKRYGLGGSASDRLSSALEAFK
jgi:hypothetical protein